MNNSILDIENTFTTGDHLAYLMSEAKKDASCYACVVNGLYSENWMYQSLSREQIDKIFSHAPEGFIEFLIDNGYIYLSSFGKFYLLKSKLRNIISVKR
jgi:hypothetical protein